MLEDSFSELWPLLERAELLVLCSPFCWYAMSGHIECAIERFFPYSSRETPRDMAVREAMLLMVGGNASFAFLCRRCLILTGR